MEMATHSSTLAWRIPWREEPGRLQSMGLQRVGHDWATSLTHSLILFTSLEFGQGLEKDIAMHSSILAWKNPMDRGAWRATVHRVARVVHDSVTKPPPVGTACRQSSLDCLATQHQLWWLKGWGRNHLKVHLPFRWWVLGCWLGP